MKSKPSHPAKDVSTYAMLIGSEDKEQSVSETIVYLLLMLTAAFSMWFVAHQPIRLPLGSVIHTVSASSHAAPASQDASDTMRAS